MDGNVQLIVAVRQQPSVSDHSDTLQPMVAKTTLGEKKAFSEALNSLLDQVPAAAADRKRAPWVAKVCKVRYQSAYKYLNAQSIPSRDKIRRLVAEIGPQASVLLGGKNPRESDVEAPGVIGEDHFGRKLSIIWDELPEDAKSAIYGFATVYAHVLPAVSVEKKENGSNGNGTPEEPN